MVEVKVEPNECLAEILEAALCELEEGIAVLDAEARVLFWNTAAAAITGYLSQDLLGRILPPEAYRIHPHPQPVPKTRTGTIWDRNPEAEPARFPDNRAQDARPILVDLNHRQGHTLPAMLRRTPLRNDLGRRFGTLLRFHTVEEIDALPLGGNDDQGAHSARVELGQAEMRDRLDELWRDFTSSFVPFGLLWINVDQAAMLRKTHGQDASEAMLAIVERTLLHGLRPSEILGRWGDNEFLVLSHERSEDLLEAHARHLAGLARTADFRWWGDRVSLTLSIGAAQAAPAETLRCLLQRARHGMEQTLHSGGNGAALTRSNGTGGFQCSQS